MATLLHEHPGLLYVVATLLPLASFLILLLTGGLRQFVRSVRTTPAGAACYRLLGGDAPGRTSAYVATCAMALAFVLSLVGFVSFYQDQAPARHPHGAEGGSHAAAAAGEARWTGRYDWAQVGPISTEVASQTTVLQLGYRIDSLTVIMFLMVTFIATLIHIFSIGYMSDELQPVVEDHHVYPPATPPSQGGDPHASPLSQGGDAHASHPAEGEEAHASPASEGGEEVGGHLRRRGRFGRFFLFLSLFCFSMLNLVLADNLFQVFVSWELVGICSYLLIGFYYERHSAANAANKAFITNRVGDVGFLLGLLIVWTYVGSFNFQEIFQRLPTSPLMQGSMHWLWVAAGLGIFLGCIGKSAQFPLHVWLPDAMEGPTPVSALIHAATMVAAGVYLVGRVYPLFTEETRLVIAYTGAITLFMAATIAVVMTDIKKVLAYSTVSQLGYMMLALGVGGWVAGLFHLLTHAFFKALLFLCSGSVIYGCHHEQDMTKMGGLYPRMKVTALTMLAGVLAIGGLPLFSGWYSKDAILAQALGFSLAHNEHILLFLLPLLTAGITAFYMFRMWFLTFTGRPRDHHVHEHAHESPRWMTVPLIILAVGSIVVAWGMPPWQAEQSFLGGHEGFLQMSEPTAALERLGLAEDYHRVHQLARVNHSLAEVLAYLVGGLGLLFATLLYYVGVLDPAEAKEQFPAVHRFLWHKWYFDELYSVLLVRPALVVARWCRSFDTRVIDGTVDATARFTVGAARWDGRFDFGIVDGLVNLIAQGTYAIGARLRRVQTGYLRSYVLFLVLAIVGIFAVLSYFVSRAGAS